MKQPIIKVPQQGSYGLKAAIIVMGALLFPYLFYRQDAGINLLLYEIFTLICSLYVMRNRAGGTQAGLYMAAFIVTSAAVIIINTDFALVMNIISFGMLCGKLLWPEFRNPLATIGLVISNFIRSQAKLLRTATISLSPKKKNPYVLNLLIAIAVTLPLIVIFVSMYAGGSSFFSKAFGSVLKTIDQWVSAAAIEWFFLMILGFLITTVLLIRVKASKWAYRIECRRKKSRFKTNSKSEGLFTLKKTIASVVLLSLNGILLLQNVLDIKNIWFGFEWDGQFLKEFVHQGTWLLIFSVLISAAIVLFLIRGDLLASPSAKAVRVLAYTWLLQNVVLIFSVAIRNSWYIKYYNLAYLRIGVFIFLISLIISLIWILVKVKSKLCLSYTLKKNFLSLFTFFVIISPVPWDCIITNYNIGNYSNSYFHHDFMVQLPDKMLPILWENKKLFEVDYSSDPYHEYTRGYPAGIKTYDEILRLRIQTFLNDYQNRSWKSWNLPDYLAHQKLKRMFE